MVREVDTIIIGAGMSGLCVAIDLERAGQISYLVFEKAGEVGGTWRDNIYPGVACDVPSHLYSYSFEPNPDWSRPYGPGPEIFEYLKSCAEKYDVSKRIHFSTAIASAAWRNGRWKVTSTKGEKFTARFLVSAVGLLHVPSIPAFPGSETYSGTMFHTSAWPEDLETRGKRVAVIGTGASSVQCSPVIAEHADHLTVFQRSPVWVLPKDDEPFTPDQKKQFHDNPESARALREELWRQTENLGVEAVTPGSELNQRMQAVAEEHIRTTVRDPAIAELLTPTYNITCKRPTLSNDYYAMFNRSNVTLVPKAVSAITAEGVRAGGEQFEADIVVLATGFKPTDIAEQLDITGRDGVTLAEVWAKKTQSYRSVMVPGFPNFFMMAGPNSTPLSSLLEAIEAQSKFVLSTIEHLDDSGHDSLEPRIEAQDRFTALVQGQLSQTTHNKGCTSWWTDENGYNHTQWPGSTVTYREMLAQFEAADFLFEPRVSKKSNERASEH